MDIIAEMKRQGLWSRETPDWVTSYDKRSIRNKDDFARWLQFVFLPNCLVNGGNASGWTYIVLQAKQYFSNDLKKGRLLQLLIELDALL